MGRETEGLDLETNHVMVLADSDLSSYIKTVRRHSLNPHDASVQHFKISFCV